MQRKERKDDGGSDGGESSWQPVPAQWWKPTTVGASKKAD